MSDTDATATEVIKVAENPAVEQARETDAPSIMAWHTFSTGIRGRLKGVSPSLIEAVVSRIKDPQIPRWHNPEKDREEDNPSDPSYLEALEEANHKRGLASMDALAMFGVELQDGLPEDDMWVFELKMLGIDIDPNDKIAKTFAYKRYIAIGGPEFNALTSMFSLTEQGVSSAMRSFRR